MAQKVRLRALKKQRVRDAIVDAALRLFATKGFAATTVEDIAASAEVAPRTFYRYFPTKEDVAFTDQDAEDKVMAEVMAERRDGESDIDLLTRAIRAVLTVSESNLERMAGMYKVIQETPAVQARALQMMIEGERKIVETLLANGDGTPEAEFRARVLAASVAAAARSAFIFWLESGQRGSLQAACDSALALLRSSFQPGRAGELENHRTIVEAGMPPQ
jgi:AcrR family transcriptional regulator